MKLCIEKLVYSLIYKIIVVLRQNLLYIFSTVCRTKGGPSTNTKCVFPFIFKNTNYNKCVFHEDDGYWCSTKVDSSAEHIGNEGNWGVCGTGCPIKSV